MAQGQKFWPPIYNCNREQLYDRVTRYILHWIRCSYKEAKINLDKIKDQKHRWESRPIVSFNCFTRLAFWSLHCYRLPYRIKRKLDSAKGHKYWVPSQNQPQYSIDIRDAIANFMYIWGRISSRQTKNCLKTFENPI